MSRRHKNKKNQYERATWKLVYKPPVTNKTSITVPAVKEVKPAPKAYVHIDLMSYLKMRTLVNQNSTEVAWHGYAKRINDDTYEISDILVYPQKVTGSHVDFDDLEYQKWLCQQEVNDIRFQGHSHVNMSTFASNTDSTSQKTVVDMLGDEDFYIFLITNKSEENNWFIYDKKTGNNYLKENVTMSVWLDDKNVTDEIDKWMKDSKDKIEIATPTFKSSLFYPSTSYKSTAVAATTTTKKKDNYYDDYYDSFYDDYYGYGYGYDDYPYSKSHSKSTKNDNDLDDWNITGDDGYNHYDVPWD